MPRATNTGDNGLVKLLLIGDSGAGKDHWICEAAEAGFNVILNDGDVATQTVNRRKENGDYFFSEEARNRIFIFDFTDKMLKPLFQENILAWIKARPSFMWDDTNQKLANPRKDDLSESTVWEVTPSKFTSRDIWVIDTWTSLMQSVKQEVGNRTGVDIGQMDRADQSVYASYRNRADQILSVIKGAPCHVVVLAHPEEYAKMKKERGKQKRQAQQEVEFIKAVPLSCSKPHGRTMGGNFSEVLWIESNSLGKRFIDARPDVNKVVKSRWTERKETTEYSFANLVRASGGTVPQSDGTCEGIIEHPPGTFDAPEPGAASKPTLGTSGGQKAIGLKGLLNK